MKRVAKIAIDGRLLSSKPTGISRYTNELIISYENKYGRDNVFVICDSDKKLGPYNIIHTKLKPFNFFDIILFYFFFKKHEVDIYHSAFYSGLIFRVKNVIQVLTVHDLMFYKLEGFFSGNKLVNFLGKIYYKFLVGTVLQNADIIVAVSETTSNDLRAIFGFDSIVIGEGISNLEKISDKGFTECSDILSLNSLNKNDYLLYVGNNRRHKNIPFLIEAFKDSYKNHKLVLVGFEDSKLKEEPHIVNICSVTDQELSVLYKNCLAFIFPSLYEGFGLPILEAINNKCVVLSSSEGSLSEFKFKSIHFFDPRSKRELIELINRADEFTFLEIDKELLLAYDWQKKFNVFQDYLNKLLLKANHI